MYTHYSLMILVLFAGLLPFGVQADNYDVGYFLENPEDIEEQLKICSIQIYKARETGSLAKVKAAKNHPACVAAHEAKKQIKERETAKSEEKYAAQQKAWKTLQQQSQALAEQSKLDQLQAQQTNCDNAPHPVLGGGGSECAKLKQAIRKRIELDKVAEINQYRTSSGYLTEKARFILLAHTGECEKKHGREKCQHIRRAQYLDQQAYEKAFKKDHEQAKATVAQCKPAFFAALDKARAISNAGDRMRAESAVINLKRPPFDNPLACKVAASEMGTSFGSMAYEKR